MAVHRSSPKPTSPAVRTVGLGSVLVGITDLEVLVALVQGHAGADDKVTVRFNGGTIDNAADLRDLADTELTRLVVESSRITVDLASESAMARGDLDIGLEIWSRWAEPRQTWRHPNKRSAITWTAVVATLSILAVSCVGSMVYALTLFRYTPPPYGGILLLFVASLALLGLIGWGAISGVSGTRAVVVPFTADELRRVNLDSKYPRLSVRVATIAALITAAGVIATVLTRTS